MFFCGCELGWALSPFGKVNGTPPFPFLRILVYFSLFLHRQANMLRLRLCYILLRFRLGSERSVASCSYT